MAGRADQERALGTEPGDLVGQASEAARPEHHPARQASWTNSSMTLVPLFGGHPLAITPAKAARIARCRAGDAAGIGARGWPPGQP